MLKIENGVPIPPLIQALNHSKGHGSILRQLKPGQSVVLPITNRAAAVYYGRLRKWRPGAVFVGRKVENGYRIWCESDTFA